MDRRTGKTITSDITAMGALAEMTNSSLETALTVQANFGETFGAIRSH
jgi:hypothetical protein